MCQQLTGISAHSVVTCLLGPSPLRTVPHAAEENWLAADGLLCADSCAGVDGRDVSAPGAPSESSAGGLYKDVFLQITRWANIQKLLHCRLSSLGVITELKRSIWYRTDILFYLNQLLTPLSTLWGIKNLYKSTGNNSKSQTDKQEGGNCIKNTNFLLSMNVRVGNPHFKSVKLQGVKYIAHNTS